MEVGGGDGVGKECIAVVSECFQHVFKFLKVGGGTDAICGGGGEEEKELEEEEEEGGGLGQWRWWERIRHWRRV